MTKRLATVGALAVLFCATGCATIVGGGTTQPVSVNSETDAATFEIRNALATTVSSGTVPGSAVLQRKGSYVVEIRADGYEAAVVPLNREVNGWFWANLLIGGIPGFIVDAITGGMYKQTPEAVSVALERGEAGALYARVGERRVRLVPLGSR